MQEFVKDVFNIPISEGGIHYLLDKLVKKALPAFLNLLDSKGLIFGKSKFLKR
jgi:hypothetical protein